MNTFLRFLVQTRFQVYMVIQERERERRKKDSKFIFIDQFVAAIVVLFRPKRDMESLLYNEHH